MSRQDGGGGPHGSGFVHDYPQTDRYNFGTMTNWKWLLILQLHEHDNAPRWS